MNLKIDKEFESRIPPLTSDEFQQLEANILADGIVINPIIVWNGVIVDGHNRYHIIEKHPEIKYTTYEKHFDDRFAVIAWICKNQLGRRNLTPDQKRYLVGKQYEAEKATRGGNHGNQYSNLAKCQIGTLPKQADTAGKIAKENGIGRRSVYRAETYAKAVDMADEVDPGIRSELLSGKLKATEKDIKEFVSAEPDKRPAIIDRIRNPPEQDKPKKKAPKPKDPELALIQKIADDMLEARSNGKPGTMVYEMTDAMESMIFRWNFCKSNYPAFFELEECLSEIRKLIRNGHEFLAQYEGGLPHYDDTCTPLQNDGAGQQPDHRSP